MRLTHLLRTLAVLLFAFSAHAQTLHLVDVLEPLYPDSNAAGRYSPTYALDVPMGAPADVHLLLADVRPGGSFTVSATHAGRPLPLSCWSQLVDVPVEQNTGLDSRTEQFTKQHNPYVIRRAPFRVFEAIRPLERASVNVHARCTALRLSIPAATLGGPGRKRIAITATGRNWNRIATLTVMVHAAKLPGLKESTFLYTNWFNLVQMETRHNLTRWSAEWFRMLDRYAGLMASGRQNCVNIPGELIAVDGHRITLDETRLAAFVDVFRKHGFRYFESPHLMYRGDNDDWAQPDLTVSATRRRYSTPEGKRDVATLVTLIRDFIARHDLGDGWLQHISDEPSAVQARCYADVALQVRSIAPGIRIMDATSDRDTLAGAIDIWCPTIDDFQKNESFFRTREQHGEKVLVYTCLVPGGQWLNRLLDQERLRQVYFGWGGALYNTAGYLHWGLNQYIVDDPFRQSVVHHPSPVATPENFLPAGDTHIIYPDPAGPLSSTRFEAMRIGVEDFELLRMLKKRDSAGASRVIGRVFRNYIDYTTDVAVYRAARKALLEAMSR